MSAPSLNAGDIRMELDRVFSRQRRSWMTALYGSGEAGTVSAAGREWEVIPTRSEMELRAAMPELAEGEDQARVFLIDWTEKPLPLDLSSRLAAGRIFQISRGTRLAVLLGAREAEPGLMGTGLASVLLSGELTGLKKVSGLRLTRRDAMRRFLDAWAGFTLVEPLTAASVTAFAAINDLGPGLCKRGQDSDAWAQLRSELATFIREEAGPLAALAWSAWEQGLGLRFLQVAALVDAHTRHKDVAAGGLLEGRLVDLAPGFGTQLLAEADRLAVDGLLQEVFDRLGIDLAVLQQADGLVAQPLFTPTRAASPWLPTGHAAREGLLGAALSALATEPTPAAFDGVLTAMAQLDGHHLDPVLRTAEQRETRRMALRLSAWLVSRAQRPAPGPGPKHQQALGLAESYAQEGGFVDWCRGRLRSPLPFHPELNGGVHATLKAADTVRRGDDEAFSEGLVHWLAAGRPATRVTPIDRATGQFVGELSSAVEGLRVLVVLMDGMSWTAAVQILQRLQTEQWAPVSWRPKGHVGRPSFPPVLASVPSLTQVSRADFFSGRFDRKSGDKHTNEDTKRWAANSALLKANDQAALPALIMRSKLMDGEGLHESVKSAIDSEAAVVGVVVNAIDEDLKGSSQTLCDYSRDVIKPLTGLMTAAAGAERVVLLASDHGHVLGDAMKTHGQALSGDLPYGRRWRALGPHDTPFEFERVLPKSTWCPAGAQGVAAIWDETVAHKYPTYGHHGGLSLAEVVAPTLLLAPDWLHAVGDESIQALETRPFPTPRWWDLELEAARPKPQPPKPPKVQAQVGLPGIEPQPAPPPPPAPALPGLVAQLKKSRTFKAQTDGVSEAEVDRVLGWLAVLVTAGGAMADREFARQSQSLPHRVGGVVAKMGRLLNCDGYAMVEHDRQGGQVRLHRERLAMQYGLDG